MTKPLKASFVNGVPTVIKEFLAGTDALPVSYGGTGVTNLTEFRKNLGILSNTPIGSVTISNSSYTYDKTTDIAMRIYMSNTSDNVVRIPVDSGLFTVGDWFEVSKTANGRTHILPLDGVTIHSVSGYNQINGVYGVVRATYYGNNTWHLNGDLMSGMYYNDVIDLSQTFSVADTDPVTGVVDPASGHDFYRTSSSGTGVGTAIFNSADKEIVLPAISGVYNGLAITKYGALSASVNSIGIEVTGYFENDTLTENSLGIGFISPVDGVYNSLASATGFGIHNKAGAVTANVATVYNNASAVNVGWVSSEYTQKFIMRIERAIDGTVSIWCNGKQARMVWTGFSYSTSSALIPVIYAINARAHITDIRLLK